VEHVNTSSLFTAPFWGWSNSNPPTAELGAEEDEEEGNKGEAGGELGE